MEIWKEKENNICWWTFYNLCSGDSFDHLRCFSGVFKVRPPVIVTGFVTYQGNFPENKVMMTATQASSWSLCSPATMLSSDRTGTGPHAGDRDRSSCSVQLAHKLGQLPGQEGLEQSFFVLLLLSHISPFFLPRQQDKWDVSHAGSYFLACNSSSNFSWLRLP